MGLNYAGGCLSIMKNFIEEHDVCVLVYGAVLDYLDVRLLCMNNCTKYSRGGEGGPFHVRPPSR